MVVFLKKKYYCHVFQISKELFLLPFRVTTTMCIFYCSVYSILTRDVLHANTYSKSYVNCREYKAVSIYGTASFFYFTLSTLYDKPSHTSFCYSLHQNIGCFRYWHSLHSTTLTRRFMYYIITCG